MFKVDFDNLKQFIDEHSRTIALFTLIVYVILRVFAQIFDDIVILIPLNHTNNSNVDSKKIFKRDEFLSSKINLRIV